MVLTAVLLVTGCSMLPGSGSDGADTGSTGRPSARATTTPRPTPTPPPHSDADHPARRGTHRCHPRRGGDVAEGAPATVSGTGPSDIAFRVRGDFGVVADLDCSGCTGTATITAPGRMSPFGSARAPLKASFVTSVLKNDPEQQMLIIEADGPWSLTLRSWNDLATVSGPQSGTGPAVLFFSDDVGHVQVDYTPADADDRFGLRVFTTSDATRIYGNTEAFSETFEADLPGILAIATNGKWSVTPTP
ncbi:hypothetical protein [Curtobacterium sp. MCPF17_052]|uniref:hypothetical protein n=1 Tax=Curtobacterium sp. MCPF17_052 TaxID=2175655 RepID=UPI0024DF3E1C|nr:hypothetical protein [Curtobacterium sp. MCPF17_052]WIB13240.1 hypothetical protein DEJ36_05060 [Curtobacterium sp. MCPF17_052]